MSHNNTVYFYLILQGMNVVCSLEKYSVPVRGGKQVIREGGSLTFLEVGLLVEGGEHFRQHRGRQHVGNAGLKYIILFHRRCFYPMRGHTAATRKKKERVLSWRAVGVLATKVKEVEDMSG